MVASSPYPHFAFGKKEAGLWGRGSLEGEEKGLEEKRRRPPRERHSPAAHLHTSTPFIYNLLSLSSAAPYTGRKNVKRGRDI